MEPQTVDYLVVGAGPAGLQLGYFLDRAGRDYRILEAGSAPGSFFQTFPRHRRMISINKPHTGHDDPELTLRWDWNSLLSDDPELRFTRYTARYFPDADDYLRYLNDFATTHALRIRYDTRVVEVARLQVDGDGRGEFVVTDASGRRYRARRVIAATGFTNPYIPPIPGIETAERYVDVPIDPEGFTNQRVLLIGKGNSAFETADNLTEKAAVIHIAGPSSIRFAWRSHFIGHLRAVNARFLDTYQLKTQNSVLDCMIKRIERRADGRYLVAVELPTPGRHRRVRLRPGHRLHGISDGRLDLRAGVPPEAHHPGPIPGAHPRMGVGQRPGPLLRRDPHPGRAISRSTPVRSSMGSGTASAPCTHILDQKYEHVPWPCRDLRADPAELADAVLARLNRTSALWQQFHFMSDVVLVDGSGDGQAHYYEEVPVDYVRASDLGKSRDCFTFTLEYGAGPRRDRPVRHRGRARRGRTHTSTMTATSTRWCATTATGRCSSELRLKENLDNDWTDETEHREPLREFIAGQLAADRPRQAPIEVPEQPDPATHRPQFVNVRDVEEAARKRAGSRPLRLLRQRCAGRGDDARQRGGVSAGSRSCPGSCAAPANRRSTSPCLAVRHQRARSFSRRRRSTAWRTPTPSCATARAAAAAGIDHDRGDGCPPSRSRTSPRPPARSPAEPALWFQLYIQPDLGFTEAIVRRAEAAGCRGAGGHDGLAGSRPPRARRPQRLPRPARQACAARTCASCAAGSRAAFDRFVCRR